VSAITAWSLGYPHEWTLARVSAILRCCDLRGRARLSGRCCAGAAAANRPGNPPQSTTKLKEFERKSYAVVMIRLARVGAPKKPYYRIVVIEKDRARNGRCIEVVGTYNPRTNPATVDLKHERIAYWRGVGARLSPTMEKLVTKNPPAAAEPVPDPAAA
jgi:small subunit ribosomal protein S16